MTTSTRIGRWFGSLAAGAALVCLTTIAGAQDCPTDRAPTRISFWRAEAVAGQDEYWIGILGMPVDEVLQSHLKIEHGLLVQDVVAESPAAGAGVRKHDIVLQFNDAQVTDLETLAAAISQNRDAEANLLLIRAGQQQNVKIKPSARPAETIKVTPVPPGDWGPAMQWLEKMRRGELGQGPFQMWFYPPGVTVPGELSEEMQRLGREATERPRWLKALPRGTSVTVTKPKDGPAQVVVKRGDEAWTVDENQLDQLPEDLHDGVRQMLESRSVTVIRPGDLPQLPWRDLRPWPPRARGILKTEPAETEEDEQAEEPSPDSWGRRFEEIEKLLREQQQRMREQQERLEERLDRLRRDWQQRPQTEASSPESL
jgi:membrane-associated protease RseP (regulator of RpoE activity)